MKKNKVISLFAISIFNFSMAVGLQSANAEDVGSWAVVDPSGNVVNSVVCTASFCGTTGETGGNVPGCEGCRYVEQRPNSQGMIPGFTQQDRTVTYDASSGEFKTEFKNILPVTTYVPPAEETDAEAILAPQNPISTPAALPVTTLPYAEQIGSWAVVDSEGNVINAIACQEKVCGINGDFKGKIPEGYLGGCIGGCNLVLQISPNPITGQNMGGITTSPGTKVTYGDGKFTIERTITTSMTGKTQVSVETLQDGVEINSFGQKRDLATGELLYVPIEKAFADSINSGELSISKAKGSYIFDTNFNIAKTDKVIKVVATKSGAKTKTLTLKLNSQGDLVLPTSTSLKGYKLTITQNKESLGKIIISK